jgi:apolipoprotein N-acyltransferase
MSTVRAVENNVPVLQSANGGYSFYIDARGRFMKLLNYGQAGTLQAEVPLHYTAY